MGIDFVFEYDIFLCVKIVNEVRDGDYFWLIGFRRVFRVEKCVPFSQIQDNAPKLK